MTNSTERDRNEKLGDANSCIAIGASLGAVGTGTALLAGATCPLCVVIVAVRRGKDTVPIGISDDGVNRFGGLRRAGEDEREPTHSGSVLDPNLLRRLHSGIVCRYQGRRDLVLRQRHNRSDAR